MKELVSWFGARLLLLKLDFRAKKAESKQTINKALKTFLHSLLNDLTYFS
jgi:hypothetical protein